MDFKCDNLGYLLNKASRLTKCKFDNVLSSLGLTSSQWLVLKDIYIHEDKEDRNVNLMPATIANRLRYDRPTISGIIERLVKQELVYKVIHPEDKRSQMVMLTDKARELMPKTKALCNGVMDGAIEGLDNAEISMLKKCLIQIINNYDEQEIKDE